MHRELSYASAPAQLADLVVRHVFEKKHLMVKFQNGCCYYVFNRHTSSAILWKDIQIKKKNELAIIMSAIKTVTHSERSRCTFSTSLLRNQTCHYIATIPKIYQNIARIHRTELRKIEIRYCKHNVLWTYLQMYIKAYPAMDCSNSKPCLFDRRKADAINGNILKSFLKTIIPFKKMHDG